MCSQTLQYKHYNEKKKKTNREGEKVEDMEFQRYGRKLMDFPEVN